MLPELRVQTSTQRFRTPIRISFAELDDMLTPG